MASLDEVKDKEYTNWLLVNLALHYMKSGVHTFIKREFNCLHQSLVQKIYGGQTAILPPCTICHASRVRKDENGVWAFKKRCRSDCAVWLEELLALHANPKSEEIYWNNSNVSLWPFQPWECAKVYMPRGRQFSNSEPSECDAQSLLMLLDKCTQFHLKLSPKGLSLAQTISAVCNKIMHDSEMKLSDADRMSSIQQIIQLLEDPVHLKSLDDCKAAVSNIHKIDNDSLDADLEMTALRAVVNEFRLELGIQEKRTLDTADSLKEECRQLREHIKKRFEDDETKKLSIQEDEQSVKSQINTLVQQKKKHQDMPTTVITHEVKCSTDVEDLGTESQECKSGILTQRGNNNTNRKRKAVGKGISESGIPEKLHRRVLNQCLPELVKNLDFDAVSIYIQEKEIFDDVTMGDILGDGASSGMKRGLIQWIQQRDQDTYEKFKECLVLAKQGYLKDVLEEEEERVAINKGIEKLHQSVLNRCLPELVKNLDFKAVSVYIQQKEILDDVTMEDIKHDGLRSGKIRGLVQRIQQRGQDTYEKFKECLVKAKQGDLKDILEEVEKRIAPKKGIETAPNRRPESDGLKQLKSQTENKLGSIKMLGYIPTTQAAEAEKLLEEKRSVVIKGNPGEGKTTIALHLIDNEMYRNRRVVVYNPEDWKTVDTDWVDIVVLDDMLGKFDLDPSRLQEWMVYLPTIQEHVDARNLKVIITTRNYILDKAYSNVESLKLFSDHLSSLTLSSKNLNKLEKMDILNRELQRHNKTMNDDEKEKCIANFSGLIGFPHCCSLFAASSNLFDKGPKFFRFPEKMFFVNINELKNEIFISLAFLFCQGEIYEDHLSPETMSKSSNDLFMDLASHLHISKEKADITLLRDAYESFGGMYIEKSVSNEIVKGVSVKRSCILFSHATVCEAVGQVLAKRSLEMVVKHCDPEYLYQRTYTAEAKDKTSEKVFLPVSMYSHMAERMVHDVVEKTLVKSAAKHSVLKQNKYLMKLKDVLHKGNRIKDFFMANRYSNLKFRDFFFLESRFCDKDLSEGECLTFLQHVLQSDDVTVRSVFNHFMEFFVCTHNNNNSDCWQCKEKQNVLELALYYHFFQIADKLITMNAYYTHVSLCNAARHGDLSRVQTILENLKRSQVFDPDCTEAKKALCRAYLSRSQDVVEILLQEGITLDSIHLVHAVKHGDIDVLKNVVEHLKFHNKWHQLCAYDSKFGCYYDPDMYSGQSASILLFRNKLSGSTALYIAYCNEKFEMADYLLQNEAKISMGMLAAVLKHSSKKVVDRVIQQLKVTHIWDPNCDDASQALGKAFGAQKYDVCDLLIQEGVSITMKHVPHVVLRSLDYVKTVVKQLKDTDCWNPKCDDASEALANAYRKEKYDVCDLLIQEGVSLTMKNLPDVVLGFNISLEAVKKAVQHLKDTKNWDPNCKEASGALAFAYRSHNYDVCDLLIQEGVSITMKHVPHVILRSLDYVKTVVKQLKDTDCWNPKCDDASEALANAYRKEKYDVCDLLIQEGISLTMKNLRNVVFGFNMSLEAVKKAVQHLKDTKNWDPNCKEASEALEVAYKEMKYDVCDLLIQEGVSLTMKNLQNMVLGFMISLEAVKKAVQHLKDTKNWDPNCKEASEAFEVAYKEMKYDVCDLLIQEGVSLTMKNLQNMVLGFMISLEAVKKAVQHLKDTKNWDPNCKEASEALEVAYKKMKYDVCDLLIQEGVSITMKHVPHVVLRSLDYVKTVVKQLKDTDCWNPKCDDASEALANAYRKEKYDVCDLLIQEGVSLTMKNLPDVVLGFNISLEAVKKAVQHLKDTKNWDPNCKEASKALAFADVSQKYDVCDLLIQEGVSLTMKNLQNMVLEFMISSEAVKKPVQHLKDTKNWDPNCKDVSEALEEAYGAKKYDVCDLLIQEGVSLTMKCIPHVILRSLDYVKTVVNQLKDTESWDPLHDDASKALEEAYRQQKYDVCDLLIQEGVSLTVKNLPHVVAGFEVSVEAVKKVVQHLKDRHNWDPKCNDASIALEDAYGEQRYDVCDLLIQEGVLLTMKNIPGVVYRVSLKHVKKAIQHLDGCFVLIQNQLSLIEGNHIPMGTFQVPLETVKKAIEHLKENKNWDAKSDEASEALANAYSAQMYDVCDMLLEETVSLTMKNLPGVVWGIKVSCHAVIKAMQHLKTTDIWDPKCEYASKALATAYRKEKYDVCDLLIQEGVSLTMQNFDGVVEGYHVSLEAVKKALQHLKDTDNWVPSCEHASKALENAYVVQKYDVCDLLIQEGVSLSMKNIPGVVYSVSAKYVIKVIEYMNRYDVFDLLFFKRVSLTLKNLPYVLGKSRVSLKAVRKVIHHLKETNNWDPKSDYASIALANAYSAQIYDVYDLLVQEGVLPDNEESSSNGAGNSGIIESS